MPYSKERYGSRKQFRKLKRCIRKVRKKDEAVNPYAVCREAIYGKGR